MNVDLFFFFLFTTEDLAIIVGEQSSGRQPKILVYFAEGLRPDQMWLREMLSSRMPPNSIETSNDGMRHLRIDAEAGNDYNTKGQCQMRFRVRLGQR